MADLNGLHFTIGGIFSFFGGAWAIARGVNAFRRWVDWRRCQEQKMELTRDFVQDCLSDDKKAQFNRLWDLIK